MPFDDALRLALEEERAEAPNIGAATAQARP
jgi:hypothetical protein